MLAAVSYRDPASIHTPTVAVSDPITVSEATRNPDDSVVTSVEGALSTYEGNSSVTTAEAEPNARALRGMNALCRVA